MLYLSPKQRHRKCAIYRGEGGAGDATADASNAAALADSFADAANASAGQASISALAASNSAIDAATSATAAASSASAAATSATNASNSATASATSATNAANSATTAETAQTAAELAETNAETAQAAAASSASAASASQAAVATSAANAANSATASATSATNAANSATVASTNATNASTSATAAASSASAASTSASNASTSATNAAASATAASGSATTATTQAGIATTQATNASNSATASATSATNSSNSASAASTSASNAATSATNAGNSATAAATSESNAAASAAAAAASYDNFDDRYLGSKSAAPTLDNDGNTLLTGALYYNNGTVTPADKGMYVYDGTQWIAASAASTAILTVFKYTATAGQTTFTGADDNAVTLTYTAGSAIITVNGAVMEVGTDVTATSGTSIVLAQAALVGDEVNIYAFATFNIANTYTQAQVDAGFLPKANPTFTGVLTGAAGTVSAPAITTTGDTNTGIYFPAADTIAFSEGGVESMRLDSSGNLGVGTTSPTANRRLDAVISANASAGIRVQNSNAGTATSSNTSYSNGTSNHEFGILGTGYSTYGVLSASEAYIYGSGQNISIGADGASAVIKFGTGSGIPERMRIDSSGNLLVGTTSGTYHRLVKNSSASIGCEIANTSATTGSRCLDLSMSTNGDATGTFIRCADFGAFRFQVLGNGNAQNVNNSYGSISDIKLKENIVDATPKLEKLKQVRIVNYNLIGEEQKQIGVIAQELEQVFPSMVDESPDRDKEGNDLGTTTKSVKYSVFVPMLIKAIQELNAKLDAQAARIATLEGAV